MRILKKELWPIRIELKDAESDGRLISIENWLGENMGAFKGRWNLVYQGNRTDFYFRDSKDAVMFSLRWS